MRRWNLSGSERIEEEYRKLTERWMRIHYRVMLFAMTLAAAAEMGMYLILRQTGPDFRGAADYWVRFVAVPIAGNVVLNLIGEYFFRSKRFNQRQKIWAASLLTSLMVLWIYTIHMFYAAMSLIFVVPALLVMAYGSRRLVMVVSVSCFFEKVFADLFFNGWSGRLSPLEDSGVMIDFIMAVVLLVLFFVLAWFITGIESDKNNAGISLERERHLYKMRSITDVLTQLGNRLALEEGLLNLKRKELLPRCHAAMLDMDEFKQLNDTHGHARGDDCLRALGASIRAVTWSTWRAFAWAATNSAYSFWTRATKRCARSARACIAPFTPPAPTPNIRTCA